MKKSNWIIIIFAGIYTFVVLSHTIFSDSIVNKYLSKQIGFAHFYSFPILIGLSLSIVFGIGCLILLYKKKNFRNKVFLSFLTICVMSLVFMGFGRDSSIEYKGNLSKETIKIVEWNVANYVDEKHFQEIFGEFDADIAVFPELEGYFKADESHQRLRDIFTKAGIDYNKYDFFKSAPHYEDIAPVTVIIKKEFERYRQTEDKPVTSFGTVYLYADQKDKPNIVGLHTAPPLPFLMDSWALDLKFISEDIAQDEDAIIIGDFNATTRHGEMNDIKNHQDALNYMAKFDRGTWNTNMSRMFQTNIDHIYLPKDKYAVKDIKIKDMGSSDHLAIFAKVGMIIN